MVGSLPPTQLTAGDSASVVLKTFDQYGNPLIEGSGDLLVRVLTTKKNRCA